MIGEPIWVILTIITCGTDMFPNAWICGRWDVENQTIWGWCVYDTCGNVNNCWLFRAVDLDYEDTHTSANPYHPW